MRRSDLVVGRTYTGELARVAVKTAFPRAWWTCKTPCGLIYETIPAQGGHIPRDGEEWTLRCLDVRELQPPTLPPEPPEGFVRVRVAVAVNARGEWDAAGWRCEDADTSADVALDLLDEHPGTPEAVHFVTADVPLPTVATVVGVCDAE